MPFSNATQPELEELLAALRLVEQRLQRVAQGSYPAPLDPTPRLELANLSTRLANALTHLDVIGEGTVSLGPNDVIVDKTLPVPVYDDASGTSGSAVMSVRAGQPVVDLTESPSLALMKQGQSLAITSTDQPQFVAGALSVVDGVPKGVHLNTNVAVGLLSEPMTVANADGSSAVQGRMTLGGPAGPRPGKIVGLLPTNCGVAAHGAETRINTATGVTRLGNCKVRVNAGKFDGVDLPTTGAIVVNGGSYGSTGQRYTVTVEANVITKIEPTV